MLKFALTTVVFMASYSAYAKTPIEVYEQAAKSTVVVRNIGSGGKANGMGSGVVLPDRDVITNCHVVKDASQLKVRIGGKEHSATLRYSDWDRDVCSLSVAGLRAPTVVVGSTRTLKVGAKVYAIGAPKGLELTLSDGIVSSLREVDGGHYIQTTASISPGSSGGGLFDENGMLIGLTTFYLTEGQNLNFAVPVEWVKELPKRSVKTAAAVKTTVDWINKAIELDTLKNWSAAIEHALRWTNAQPNNGISWFSLGAAYGEDGQFNKAIEATQEALHINPEHAEAWNNLGTTYSKLGQLDKAMEAFQKSLRINQEDAVTWYNLGNAYSRLDMFDKAMDAYQNALRINPEHAEAWINLGVIYRVTGLFNKAIEASQKALRINPEAAEAWNNLGLAYGMADQFDKAVEALQQALRINPGDAEVWDSLGLAYSVLGQRGKVIEVYKRLKELDPSRAERFFNEAIVP